MPAEAGSTAPNDGEAPPNAETPAALTAPTIAEPVPAPRPSAKRARKVIEFDDTAEAPPQIELMSAWEFVTWQPTADAPEVAPAPAPEAAPEPESDEKLELADAWEFVRWTPDEELPEPEPEAEPTKEEEEPPEGS